MLIKATVAYTIEARLHNIGRAVEGKKKSLLVDEGTITTPRVDAGVCRC